MFTPSHLSDLGSCLHHLTCLTKDHVHLTCVPQMAGGEVWARVLLCTSIRYLGLWVGLLLFVCFLTHLYCLVGCLSRIVWTHSVLGVLHSFFFFYIRESSTSLAHIEMQGVEVWIFFFIFFLFPFFFLLFSLFFHFQ